MSVTVETIVNSQVHIGTLKSEAHPKTRKYRLDIINGVVVFNPEIIVEQLENAKARIKKAKDAGKDVLFVCEKKMYAEETEKLATAAGVHYLNYKVPAGFLTNFDTFKTRVWSMNKMLKFLESAEYESLTKKEQLMHKRSLNKIQKIYKGVQGLSKKPDLVVVVDGQNMRSFVDEIQKESLNNIIISSSNFARRRSEKNTVMANVWSYKSMDHVIKYLLSL